MSSFGLTKAQLRRLRKRARVVRSTEGGYTSHHGAAQHVEAQRAVVNAAGELVFRAPLPRFIERPYDPVDGYRFRWYADQSGGVAVMKAAADASARLEPACFELERNSHEVPTNPTIEITAPAGLRARSRRP